jgi:hypothetical protein
MDPRLSLYFLRWTIAWAQGSARVNSPGVDLQVVGKALVTNAVKSVAGTW